MTGCGGGADICWGASGGGLKREANRVLVGALVAAGLSTLILVSCNLAKNLSIESSGSASSIGAHALVDFASIGAGDEGVAMASSASGAFFPAFILSFHRWKSSCVRAGVCFSSSIGASIHSGSSSTRIGRSQPRSCLFSRQACPRSASRRVSSYGSALRSVPRHDCSYFARDERSGFPSFSASSSSVYLVLRSLSLRVLFSPSRSSFRLRGFSSAEPSWSCLEKRPFMRRSGYRSGSPLLNRSKPVFSRAD